MLALTNLMSRQFFAIGKFNVVLRTGIRGIKLAALIAYGLIQVSFYFPFSSAEAKRKRIQAWSKSLVEVFGIKIRVYQQANTPLNNTLVLANHVSWLDIMALNAVHSSRFVAKSNIGAWPIVGYLCKKTGTLFIEREKKSDVLRLNREIRAAVKNGDAVTFFPEGTTTDGSYIRKFKSPLLQTCIDDQLNIQAIYLRYIDQNGQPCNKAAYYEDIHFGESLWCLLGASGISVELYFLPITTAKQNESRHDLSLRIENSLRDQQQALHQGL